jgi:sulfur relay (sulfurtransferase) DsrC/TusE family protein
MPTIVGIPTSYERDPAALKRGEEGFRLGARDWHPDLIEIPSDDDVPAMSPDRCDVVDCIRSGFEKNPCAPKRQVLLKHLQDLWDKSKVSHRHLYQLLRRGYGQRPAGLMACTRIPPDLMLDV